MSDQSNESTLEPHNDEGGHSRPREILPKNQLPPKLSCWENRWSWIARIFMVLGVCFLVYICFQLLWDATEIPDCRCWTYVALSVFLVGLVTERFLYHERRVHEARTEDQSEIEALIQEAGNVRPRLPSQNKDGQQEDRPKDFAELKKQVDAEVQRLTQDLAPDAWTDYQILTLDRLLIDFLKIEDLKARARSSLVDLEEYATGDTFSYDSRLYYEWKKRIDEDIKAIDKCKDDKKKQDSIADELRADLRSLFEHVANYGSNWAQGKTIVNSIRICGAAAVLVFLLMGLLEVIYQVSDTAVVSRLGILHWGFLGSAGAITSVLNSLRDSNEVEVGNTRGVQELWRAVLGAILGFVAGILIFSALAGGLINHGAAVPNLVDTKPEDVYLSIMWAVVAGMGFENVFRWARSAAGHREHVL